jgi:aconitate hydratase 2/2-methylisocitrate dehydratase
MTRDELKDLACLGFSADLVMQSFCHTAAYPKLVDVKMHRELPSFISTRGGVVAASGRRRDPLLAQPPAAARHRRHRR